MNKFKQMLDQIRKAWVIFYANVIGAIVQFLSSQTPSIELKNVLPTNEIISIEPVSKTTVPRSKKRFRQIKKRVKR